MPALGLRQAGDLVGHEHRVLAGVALLGVVVQDPHRPLPQKQDGNQVDDRHEGHRDVGEIPSQREVVQAADHDRRERRQAENEQHDRAFRDEADIAHRVEVVADQTREGEREDRERHQMDAELADCRVDRHLNERHAV